MSEINGCEFCLGWYFVISMKNRKLKGKGTRLNVITNEDDGRPDIYQRLTRLLLGLFLLGLIVLVMSYFMPEVDKQKTVNAELVTMQSERDAYKRQRDKMSAHLERLQTNREYFELFARDRLDKRLEGETIYRIEEIDGNVPKARAVEGSEDS